jgi:TolB protein
VRASLFVVERFSAVVEMLKPELKRSTTSGLILLLLLCAGWGASAQVVVQKSAYAMMTSLPPFTGDPTLAAQATKILSSDLDRSGWFKIVASGAGEINIVGSASRSGGGFTLSVQIFSRAGGGAMYAGTFSGNADGQLRQKVHELADDIVAKVAKQKGIAQTKIAFVSNRTGKKEVYVMDYDAFNVRQLTQDGSISARPRWSPDRSKLVYTSYKSRWPDVYVIELGSGRRTRVASYPGLNTGAAFSPSGNELAVILSKDGNPELYVIAASGGNPRRLTRSPKGGESSPCWSPNGSQVAFSSDVFGLPNICTISAFGGASMTRLTAGGYYTEPDWSPTGNLIACVGRVGRGFQIFTFDPSNPSGTFKQQTSDGADNQDPTWAPDGRHIVFSKTSGYRSQLYVLDVLTGTATTLGLNLSDCIEPAWSK